MDTCPDCIDIKRQVENNPSYQIIEIGQHVRNLKEFLRLRDTSSVFDEAKREGYIGIPCFVLGRRARDACAGGSRIDGAT